MTEVQRDVPVSTWSYPAGFKGTEEARAAVAHVMQRTFLKVSKPDCSAWSCRANTPLAEA